MTLHQRQQKTPLPSSYGVATAVSQNKAVGGGVGPCPRSLDTDARGTCVLVAKKGSLTSDFPYNAILNNGAKTGPASSTTEPQANAIESERRRRGTDQANNCRRVGTHAHGRTHRQTDRRRDGWTG